MIPQSSLELVANFRHLQSAPVDPSRDQGPPPRVEDAR